MTSSYKLLPDEEPGPEDEAQRALIKACLQVIQEMREGPEPLSKGVKRFIELHEELHKFYAELQDEEHE